MKIQTIVITVLSAVLGIMTSLLMDARGRISALEAQQRPAVVVAAATATDTTNVADLRERITVLEQRVSTAPSAWKTTAVSTGAEVANADGVPAPVVDATVDALKANPAVQQLVRSEMDKAEADRETARTERFKQRTREKIDTFAKDNALNEEQHSQILTMVDAEVTELRSMFKDARDTGDFASARTQAQTLRVKTEENAKAILDDKQFEAFKVARDEERSRFSGLAGPPAIP